MLHAPELLSLLVYCSNPDTVIEVAGLANARLTLLPQPTGHGGDLHLARGVCLGGLGHPDGDGRLFGQGITAIAYGEAYHAIRDILYWFR